MNKMRWLAAAAMMAAATPVMAQTRGKGNDGVPPGQRPAPGMCRIWIDGVPPGRQPAPTNCATAIARRPMNARIIYGDRVDDRSRRVFESSGDILRRNHDRDDDERRIEAFKHKHKGKGKFSKGKRGEDREDDERD